MLRFLLTLTFCLFFFFPLQASEPPEDAKALKSIFEQIIEAQKEKQAARGNELIYEGDITIEETDGYYAVTLPHAKMIHRSGNTMDIGMIAVNAKPHRKPGQWQMRIAIPTPFILRDETGETVVTVSIGAQKSAGIWNEQVGAFVKFKGDYRDITIKNPSESFLVKIKEISASNDLSQDDQGRYTGPIEIKLADLSLTNNNGQAKLSLGSAGMTANIYDYDPQIVAAQREKLKALEENTSKSEKPSPAHMAGLSNLIFDILTEGGDGFDIHYTLENLKVRTTGNEKRPPVDLALDEAGLFFNSRGFTKNNVTVAFNADYSGLRFKADDPAMNKVLPGDINLDIRLVQFPLREIVEMARNSIQGAMTDPAAAQLTGMALLIKLPALLSQAGTRLVIEDNFIRNDTYNAELNGEALTDLKALNGMTADFTLRVYGYDDLIESLQQSAVQADGSHKQATQNLLAGMMFFKGFAKLEEDAQGNPVHIFHFDMNSQGQFLLNGQSMKGKAGGRQEGSAKEPADDGIIP